MSDSNGGMGTDYFPKMCDVDGRCIVASALPVLGHRKATINLWLYDYSIVKGTLTSEQSWSTSRVVAYVFKILVHFGALAVIICFLMTNYFVSQTVAQQQSSSHTFTGHSGNMVRRPRPAHDNDSSVHLFG